MIGTTCVPVNDVDVGMVIFQHSARDEPAFILFVAVLSGEAPAPKPVVSPSTVDVYVIGVVLVIAGATVALAKLPDVHAPEKPDGPITAWSFSVSAAAALAIAQPAAPVTESHAFAELDSFHCDAKYVESFVIVADVADTCVSAPDHVNDCVDDATVFTATETFAVIATSMFKYDGFAAWANPAVIMASSASAEAAPHLARTLIRTLR
jgi:hypothetical protein